MNPTSALRFIDSCLNIPQLWQGRDTKSTQGIETSFYAQNSGDILNVSSEQLKCVVMYILMEAEEETAQKYNGDYMFTSYIFNVANFSI